MMNFTCNRRHPLHRDGTNQYQRLLDALRPESAPVDARSMRELLRFAADYATQVQFYDLGNQPDGDWTAFFDVNTLVQPDLTDAQWLDWYRGLNGDEEPHLALFLAFLELFKYCQDHLNTLTKRHLDFYYREILALPVQEPTPDSVHVLLELAHNVQSHRLAAGTVVEAGKDAGGKPLQYGLTREIVVNTAKITDIAAIYVDHRSGFGEKIYSAPIANSKDGQGAKLEGKEPKWRLFGQPQRNLAPEKRTMTDAQPGWVIQSPILSLAGGDRKVDITLEVPDLDRNALADFHQFTNSYAHYFELHLSTDAGWYAPEWELDIPQNGPPTIKLFNVRIPKSGPAITAGKPEKLGLDLGSKTPALRFRVKQGKAFFPYRLLSNAHVSQIHIQVEVAGLEKLDLRSETSLFAIGRPFMPFGAAPVPEDRFLVGCPEALTKRLDRLSLDLEWVDLPNDFEAHYAAYAPVTDQHFKLDAELLWGGEWLPLRGPLPMFPTGSQSRLDLLGAGTGFLQPTDFGNYAAPLPATTPIPMQSFGYIRLNLKDTGVAGLEAFGHKEYSSLYVRRMMEMNQFLMGAPQFPTEPLMPNAPHTPQLRSVKLNYAASETMEIGGANRSIAGSFCYLEPLGHYALDLREEPLRFLPAFDSEAFAYLGVEHAVPGNTLSVLFQFAEGSGNNWLDMRAAAPAWAYLAGNTWKALDAAHRLYDATDNLLSTGIITFSIPSDADTAHDRLGEGKIWLRVSMAHNSAGIPAMIGIHAQAAKAVLEENGNDPRHLDQPLAGGTALRLNPAHAGLKGATLPYSSFGGVPQEDDLHYYTRVSERLRHKQRAIMIWDYERLVLHQFPSIYKVKCISHSSSSTSEYAPGTVSVIVVPMLRNVNAIDPLRPAVGQGKLAEIRNYLARHIPSLFVELVVENPSYEEILVEFSVGFHPGYDAGYYGELLNESLKRFLAPWAYEEGQDLVFGGKIHKSAIIKFIEEQPYVDFVVDFLVYHNTNGSNFAGINWMEIECNFVVSAPDVLFVEASSERSVLISANRHTITVLEPGTFPTEGQQHYTTA